MPLFGKSKREVEDSSISLSIDGSSSIAVVGGKSTVSAADLGLQSEGFSFGEEPSAGGVRIRTNQIVAEDPLPPDVAEIQRKVLEGSVAPDSAENTIGLNIGSRKSRDHPSTKKQISPGDRALLDGCMAGDVAAVAQGLANGGAPKLGLKFMFKAISLYDASTAATIVEMLKAADEK